MQAAPFEVYVSDHVARKRNDSDAIPAKHVLSSFRATIIGVICVRAK
jgi:hypothetical protein